MGTNEFEVNRVESLMELQNRNTRRLAYRLYVWTERNGVYSVSGAIVVIDKHSTDFDTFENTKKIAQQEMYQQLLTLQKDNRDVEFHHWECLNGDGSQIFLSTELSATIDSVARRQMTTSLVDHS